MSVVTISKQSYSRSKEVAEAVARQLGYECLSGEVLSEASDEFDVPEIELLRAVRDSPSLLERLTFGKEQRTAYFQAALLNHLQRDNVVYHGLAGHYFVGEVPHVLKVRILGTTEDRLELVTQRHKVFDQAATSLSGIPGRGPAGPAKGPLSRDDALHILHRSDEARQKWGLHLYGSDPSDPRLHDLVIHLKSFSVDEAAGLIVRAVALPRFQTTPASQKAMEVLCLAAQVQAALVEEIPSAKVEVEGGEIVVSIRDTWAQDKKMIAKVEQVGDRLGGVKLKIRLVSPA